MSSCPRGPTVSQRKSPNSSGNETSWRTSIPTFSVQYFNAASWSWTHRWALAIFIMRMTLRPVVAVRLLPVCCLDATVGGATRVAAQDARGHSRVDGGGRHAGPVRGRRLSVHPGEAGRERPDALKADHHPDVGHRSVGG